MSDVPSTIGRYQIEAVLGRGAMGIVYKGHDPEIDREVAIKLVRADLLSGTERDEYLVRFRQEARAAGRCAHPNIVAIYDFALHDGNPFLTMEYVEGQSLAQTFDEGTTYEPGEAIALALQVLGALAYAHEHGIVHRDIKPANVMVLPGGCVKVGDFGISRLPGSELTLAGSVIGTPSYMSPEQCRGDDVDQRSDLFSTGAVLFQLLTGEKPFPGKSVTEIVHRLMNDDPPDLRAKGVVVPAAVGAALRRALAKDPDDRFASAREMADALRLGIIVSDIDERTVVVRDPHLVVGFEAEPVRWSAPAHQPAASMTTVGRFDSATLSAIEHNLARHVGPIARLLVRNAAAKCGGIAELCAELAQRIASPQERAEFLARAPRSGEPPRPIAGEAMTIPPATMANPAEARKPLPAEELAQVQRDLAMVLGPIARLLVQRAAPGTASIGELREKLATHIPGEAERVAFLIGRGHK